MSLQQPLWLAVLALIPLAILLQRLAAARRRRYAVRFPALPTSPESWNARRRGGAASPRC